MSLHRLDIVHQDFHPGNILSSNFKNSIRISGFGLSKLTGTNPSSPEKKNIFGVLPYIAPEVLSGDAVYTKAADHQNFSANQNLSLRSICNTTTTTTPTSLNYQTHPEAIYTSRLLNSSNLSKPKNEVIYILYFIF
ncbi:hypothetical protein Glove_117g392 [Diversispora epigaea]|uniref:Protein kinase domain-containing protein n=1 Tax=Diversispora epigaea TaxID=1348612 RepID=A0A397JAC9_9GLOM|nr:hypothetical protein Glove_117g392 [Diversispora epigaea]